MIFFNYYFSFVVSCDDDFLELCFFICGELWWWFFRINLCYLWWFDLLELTFVIFGELCWWFVGEKWIIDIIFIIFIKEALKIDFYLIYVYIYNYNWHYIHKIIFLNVVLSCQLTLEITSSKFLSRAVNFPQTINKSTRQGWVVLLRGCLNIPSWCLNISLGCLNISLGCFKTSLGCLNISLGCFNISLRCLNISLGYFSSLI